MSTITEDTDVTLNGTSDFQLGDEVYSWGESRFLFVVDSWAPDGDNVYSVNFNLKGSGWGATFLHFAGSTKTVITDTTSGNDDDGNRVYIGQIELSNEGPNSVSLDNAQVNVITGYDSNDTVNVGYYVNAVTLNRGDDTITLKGAGELGYADLGRGNDTLSIGSGYIFAADMGRGNDNVKVGTGGFQLISLGRDADTIKFTGDFEQGGVVNGGESVSEDISGAKDFDTVDFSAFKKSLTIDLGSGNATAQNVDVIVRHFERAIGGSGADTIMGSADNDVLVGGSGLDKLYGRAGADIFVFDKGDTGKTNSAADVIYDFTSADKVDLRGWDADSTKSGSQDFTFIGTKAFTGDAGELRYTKASSDTYIYADTNGDKSADLVIHLDDALSLKESHFLL